MTTLKFRVRSCHLAVAVCAILLSDPAPVCLGAESPANGEAVRKEYEDYESDMSPADIASLEKLWTGIPLADRTKLTGSLRWLTKRLRPLPLYDGKIPNSKSGPDNETHDVTNGSELIRRVSHPTYTVYLPARVRASGAAVIIFPGGGYEGLSWTFEGTRLAEVLQERGIAAIIVKYRLPSNDTMINKSIGPVQDAQQVLLQVRRNAARWNLDPQKIGVIGFSAGGHLASTLGTHFQQALIPNPENLSVRPDFMILVYPVITMSDAKTHKGSRDALLGSKPSAEEVRRFSNELQVSADTPPTLLLTAENDSLVDVDNSIDFFQALRREKVPADLVVFSHGEHGFIELSREDWMAPMWKWLAQNGWLKP